jgi:prepilin-type N-terminal cleavage/methylation domain-containing protein
LEYKRDSLKNKLIEALPMPLGQRGFTLLEVMVVVIIIAILSGISFVAITQMEARRYLNHSEKLSMWFQQLSEQAELTGAPYGFMITGDRDISADLYGSEHQQLQAVVFFNYRWWRATQPPLFKLLQGAQLDWQSNNDAVFLIQPKSVVLETIEPDEPPILPVTAFLPEGNMEPATNISLRFKGFDGVFGYFWDEEISKIGMEVTVK